MCRCFGDPSGERVLSMPIKRFWLLSKSVDRLQAEDDLRAIQIGAATQTREGFQETMGRLRKQMGQVAVYDEVRRALEEECDSAGLLALKGMGNMSR